MVQDVSETRFDNPAITSIRGKRRLRMSIRFKLLSVIGICAATFAAFGIISWNTLEKTKINGARYRQIVLEKDLIADVLPPPEYLVEAYLVVYRMLEETDAARLKELVDKSASLRKDYEKQHDYWMGALQDGPVKEELTVKSYDFGLRFLDIRDKEFVPAILHNDRKRAGEVVAGSLNPLYEEHRQAIDNVVRMADEKLKAEEADADATVGKSATLLAILAAVAAGAIFMCAFYMNYIASTIIGKIRRVVEGLSRNADRFSASAERLRRTNGRLAEGASEQAAAIEETSSSLEEISIMTKRNSDNSYQADRLMAETRSVVDDAGRSMTDLNDSMSEISRAGEETQKIIRTIDEIAFQTNLLALNAAVEAARAGEAGAGFAIVAEEVRNLAVRAAEAAKNTAGLIEETVGRVRDGSHIVERTDGAFKQVTSKVTRVGELIGEIAEASREQAQGIEQVNRSVSDMDKVIQQNSATADESATSSEDMTAQAWQIKDFVEDLSALLGDGSGKGAGRTQSRVPQRASMKSVPQKHTVVTAATLRKSNGNTDRRKMTGTDPGRLILPDGEGRMDF